MLTVLGAVARDASSFVPGEKLAASWVDVDPECAQADALSKGAVRFHRLGALRVQDDALWFESSADNSLQLGQVYRHDPVAGTFEMAGLFADELSGGDLEDDLYPDTIPSLC